LSQGHNRQSRSPAELTHRYCLCAARVFQEDCHERAPWYTAHPPVSTPLSPATIASTMIPRGGTPDGSCKTQGEATRNARACTSAAITNSGRKRGRHNGRCRRLWTVRVASRLCYGHRGPEHGTTASVFL